MRTITSNVLTFALLTLTAGALAQGAMSAAIHADDQIGVGTTIEIDHVVAEVDGFVVVHATEADGSLVLTPPLGVTYVAAGEHRGVLVELDADRLAEYDYVAGGAIVPMLHVDADGDRLYAFPDGPDVPVFVDGEMVITTVRLEIAPSLVGFDQTAAAGALTVDTVIAAEPGFVVVHAFDLDGELVLTPPLGVAHVPAGVSRFVSIELDAELLTSYGYDVGVKDVLPMLHVDADGDMVYAFPDGPDVPVMVGGEMVVTTLELGRAMSGSAMLDVGDGRLDLGAEGLSVTLPSVTLPQPGFVALHAAEADGSLRVLPILGVSAWLPAGTTGEVTITIDADQIAEPGDTAFAMAHVDDGDMLYTFPRSDAPLVEGGAMVVTEFTLR